MTLSQQKNAEIGALLKEARLKQNLTQTDVSEKMGYGSSQFVSHLERGLNEIPNASVRKYCSLIGASAKKIIQLKIKYAVAEIKEEVGDDNL